MVHFQLLLGLALCAVSYGNAPTHNPYELRERINGREGLERERLYERERERLERERERLARDRIIERERLDRERLTLERNIARERLERERLAREKINERERLERLGLEKGILGERYREGSLYGLRDGDLYGRGHLQERIYGHGQGYNERYGHWGPHGPNYPLVPWVEPTKGVLSDGHSGNIELQNKIVRETYSPTYYQPEYIVDYRFLRTGGRAFTQGPGGQIIILPRGVKEVDPSGHNSYDRLIENLEREEEYRRRSPYQRVRVEGEREYQGYGRERLDERHAEYGYRVPREEPKADSKAETQAAEPKVETTKAA